MIVIYIVNGPNATELYTQKVKTVNCYMYFTTIKNDFKDFLNEKNACNIKNLTTQHSS